MTLDDLCGQPLCYIAPIGRYKSHSEDFEEVEKQRRQKLSETDDWLSKDSNEMCAELGKIRIEKTVNDMIKIIKGE